MIKGNKGKTKYKYKKETHKSYTRKKGEKQTRKKTKEEGDNTHTRIG